MPTKPHHNHNVVLVIMLLLLYVNRINVYASIVSYEQIQLYYLASTDRLLN